MSITQHTDDAYADDPHAHVRRSLRAVAERTQHQVVSIVGSSGIPRPAEVAGAGLDGVGLTLHLDVETVYAGSNAFTDHIDEVQYGLGEGPCLAAVATGRVVSSTRIGSGEHRWSRFSPRAAALALRSVTSAPIMADTAVIGSLNLYSQTPVGLGRITPTVLRRLAAAAEATLRGVRLLALADAGALQLSRALDDRATIEHAVGIFMDRYSSNANQARTLLAQLARQDGTSEALAARTVVGPGTAGARDPNGVR